MAFWTPIDQPFTDEELFDPTIVVNLAFPLVEYPFNESAGSFLMRATVIATSQFVYWPSPTPDATYAPGGPATVTDVVIFRVLS